MGIKSYLTCGIVCSGLTAFMAALGAGQGALAGLAGAKLLEQAGCNGYLSSEATQMGALGGALLSATVMTGLVFHALYSLWNNLLTWDQIEMPKKKQSIYVAGFTSQTFLAGLIGHSLMNGAGHATQMEVEQSATVFAVGSAITMLPMAALLCCVAIPSIVTRNYLNTSDTENSDYAHVGSTFMA